jgi:hypothetical protein|tara:strand:- start:875 stop:1081 length:207 start_codon:yes stop_codon:yes gene_type:complete
MERNKSLDKTLWKEVRKRITSRMQHDDFLIMCQLHAKYMKHKYHELNFCDCNARRINQWIEEVDKCLN